MGEEALISLASIVVLGIGAQWIAWRLRLPSILLLLLAGFFAGPVTQLVHPDELLGETLFPVVSISVGIILFEGGLTLKLDEISGVRRVVFRLISVGMLITWAVAALGAYFIVGLNFELALLVGAIFVVSGPTVVTPLLKHVRPSGQSGPILKWEGILIDPVGATLAVLVFEVILVGQTQDIAAALILAGIARSVLVGGLFGALGAFIMIQLFKRYWVPEYLQNPIAVMLIVAAFTASNELQAESGLLATTLMGFILANQKSVSVKHVTQFKEDLGVLLLSSLFVILAARLDLSSLSNLSVRALIFLGLLIFVGRPLAVYAATTGSRLTWRERAFIAWLAPRGIVAVAVSSLFALELAHDGYPGAERLVPLTFLVVVGTVTIYGLSAARVACWLGLAQPDPQGVLIVGAHDWARAVAEALHDTGFTTVMVDTNWEHISTAKLAGFDASYANILSEQIMEEIELSQMGYLMALTRNDEVNSLSALRFGEIFGRPNVFQIPVHNGERSRKESSLERELCGRCLFGTEVTYSYLTRRFTAGAAIKTLKLTKEFGYDAFRDHYGTTAVPLFVIDDENRLTIMTTDNVVTPRAGQTLIALVDPNEETLIKESSSHTLEVDPTSAHV